MQFETGVMKIADFGLAKSLKMLNPRHQISTHCVLLFMQFETGVMKIADFGLSKSLKMPKPKRKDLSTSHGKHNLSMQSGNYEMDSCMQSM